MMKILSLLNPMFEHDCEDCTFKGAVKHGRGKAARIVDVYTCGNEIITRHSDEPSDNQSTTVELVNSAADEFWSDISRFIDMPRKDIPWNKDLIREQLVRSDKWVERAVLSIFEYQTEAEQASDATTDDNGVGFNGVDAEFMSSLAKNLKRFGRLTPRQMPYARKKILKYSGQLAKITNSKQ
tara:strand:+ start:1435 stop:1980 length:546 start_codon:yes stop_codon:yes gene_type:complete